MPAEPWCFGVLFAVREQSLICVGFRMSQVQLVEDCSQLLAVTVPSKRGTKAHTRTMFTSPEIGGCV